MILQSMKEFHTMLIQTLTFSATSYNNYILYQNKNNTSLGWIIQYSNYPYYDLFFYDYMVLNSFTLEVKNPMLFLNFGMVQKNNIERNLENNQTSNSISNPFFVMQQKDAKKQIWNCGSSYKGIEFFLYHSFFSNYFFPTYGKDAFPIDKIPYNFRYPYLPIEITFILQQLNYYRLDITPFYLDSKVLECISIFSRELYHSSLYTSLSTNQINKTITIAQNRKISLTPSDIEAIKQAHSILTKQAFSPPTIAHLSSLVKLNSQKLQAGFFLLYQISIWEYTHSIRMSSAAKLLLSSNLSISEIAKKVGFSSNSNFSSSFKKYYSITPYQFRNYKKSSFSSRKA